MAYQILDYRQVRDKILRDIANRKNIPLPNSDSDYYARANATGVATEGLYKHQSWIAKQLFPDTCDLDILIAKHAAPRGISQKQATPATGSIKFFGTPGAPVNAGCEGKSASGVSILASASGNIGVDGTLTLAAQASLAGSAGNLAALTTLTLTNPPPGVQAQAQVAALSGGTETETKDALVARVLMDMQMPESGGATHDYFKWAMDVPGVTDAYVFTQRRVANGVDVVIETSGGLPSPTLIAAVQAYIETKRPPGSNVLVIAPTQVIVPITGVFTLNGVLAADVVPLATTALQNYFSSLNVGDTVRRTAITNLLTGIKGVIDVNLTAPAANVQPLADATHSELGVLGAINLT